jgi:hypothetical protein
MQGSGRRAARKPGEPELELPPPDTKRWSSRRKAAVIVATRTGVISRTEACRRYMLSDEELANWEEAFDRRGIPGLRSASLQLYRSGTKPVAGSAPVNERAQEQVRKEWDPKKGGLSTF